MKKFILFVTLLLLLTSCSNKGDITASASFLESVTETAGQTMNSQRESEETDSEKAIKEKADTVSEEPEKKVRLTNISNSIPAQEAGVGDEFLGWTIESIELSDADPDDQAPRGVIELEGKQTLSGTMTKLYKYNWGKEVFWFTPDEEELEKLPDWAGANGFDPTFIHIVNAEEFLTEEEQEQFEKTGMGLVKMPVTLSVTHYQINEMTDNVSNTINIDGLEFIKPQISVTNMSGTAEAILISEGDEFLGWTIQSLSTGGKQDDPDHEEDYILSVTGDQWIEGTLERGTKDSYDGVYVFHVSEDVKESMIAGFDADGKVEENVFVLFDDSRKGFQEAESLHLDPGEAIRCRVKVTYYQLIYIPLRPNAADCLDLDAVELLQ